MSDVCFEGMNVELIDCMGSDLTVVNAARVSMNKFHTLLEDNDARLIKYLAEHNHWSPFAHPQLSFRIKAPLFVARQLAKHQIGLAWNEVSRRYVDYEPTFYLPEPRRRAEHVKQGSLDEVIPGASAALKWATETACEQYRYLLGIGVAPEVARSVLPQNMMTEWVWTGSLYAFARVVNLRTDIHAQKESRDIGEKVKAFLVDKFPISSKALLLGG